MKFKRINMDTVRCLITEDELIENGLEVDDFLQNNGKTESFLRKIISLAAEEVGYKVKGGNISIQVSVLPEHRLALTFSEKPAEGILNMLESLKSAVEHLSKTTKEETDEGDLLEPSAVEEIKHTDDETKKNPPKDSNPNQNAEQAKDSNNHPSIVNSQKTDYQIKFDTMDKFVYYCNSILLEMPVDSSLYCLQRENVFYLLLKKEPMNDKQLCKILSASLEFSEAIYAHPATKAYIEEHGELIIADRAIQIIQEIS